MYLGNCMQQDLIYTASKFSCMLVILRNYLKSIEIFETYKDYDMNQTSYRLGTEGYCDVN